MPAFNNRITPKMYLGVIPEDAFYAFSLAFLFLILSQSVKSIPIFICIGLWIFSALSIAYGFYMMIIVKKLLLRKSVSLSLSDERCHNKMDIYRE